MREIPAEDEDLYRSRVTRVVPAIPGLRARILGGQEKLQVRWRGRERLVILGPQGEPMLRLSAAGIDLNTRAPSAYLSAERYARVPLPATAGPDLPPAWRRLEGPGAISWFEHRAQWMTAERPAIVGDGSVPVTIFHWRVQALLGERRVTIEGVLDWVPDAEAVRDAGSDDGRPILAAAILAGAMALGALAGALVRRRLEREPGAGRRVSPGS